MIKFELGKKTAAALSLYVTLLGAGLVEQGLYNAFEQEMPAGALKKPAIEAGFEL